MLRPSEADFWFMKKPRKSGGTTGACRGQDSVKQHLQCGHERARGRKRGRGGRGGGAGGQPGGHVACVHRGRRGEQVRSAVGPPPPVVPPVCAVVAPAVRAAFTCSINFMPGRPRPPAKYHHNVEQDVPMPCMRIWLTSPTSAQK